MAENIKEVMCKVEENRSKVEEKMSADEYDVFLSYNRKDGERIKKIRRQLIDNGIAPWFDLWDIKPGLPWQKEVEHQIVHIPAAAIFIGQGGLGPWHEQEQEAFLIEAKRRKCNVIPVILPDAPSDAEISPFLGLRNRVDFREYDPDPLEWLIWGITGLKPEKVYRPGILIASLGESPVVVSSMYELLTEEKNLIIDRVMILMPDDKDVEYSYELVREALAEVGDLLLLPEQLNFRDADSWRNACVFLQRLYKLLEYYEKQGDLVYLSLAGGRKSMAALVAWVVPFFSCIEKLYHVIDEKEEKFLLVDKIKKLPISKRLQSMHPAIDQLKLVDIPVDGKRRQIDQQLRSQLLSSLTYEFDKPDGVKAFIEPDEVEAAITARSILQEDDVPQVNVTKLVVDQFCDLSMRNGADARLVRNGLLTMSQIATLRTHEMAAAHSYKPKLASKSKSAKSITLHSFTGLQGPIRPVFYTLPEDISERPNSLIEQIVVCSLEAPSANGYRTFKEMTTTVGFSHEVFSSVDELSPVPSPVESVLIIPLGKSPMVATQLYTLLTEQEQHTIRKVVLLYPELSSEVRNAVGIVKDALDKKSVSCCLVGISDLKDIASSEACRMYQVQLEAEIERIQGEHPKYKVDLALSGGRKGMTAMTIFAAQNRGIPYVYHTLITDEQISDQIEKETTIKALNDTGLSDRERNRRLFLDAYKSKELCRPYKYFVLFKVPVFPADA